MATRRGHNEGSIYFSGGRFRGYVTNPQTGQRKYFSGESKKDVRAQVAAAKAKFAQGIFTFDSNQTLGDYLQAWLQGRPDGAIKPATRVNYAGVIRNHINPELGKVRLRNLTRSMCSSCSIRRKRAAHRTSSAT